MSHYRAPPAVLPSLRDLDAEVLAPVSEFATEPILIEAEARRRAAAAPCPAFATPPPRGVTVSGYPVLRLPPLSLTVQPGEDWRDVLASSLAPGRPVFG